MRVCGAAGTLGKAAGESMGVLDMGGSSTQVRPAPDTRRLRARVEASTSPAPRNFPLPKKRLPQETPWAEPEPEPEAGVD